MQLTTVILLFLAIAASLATGLAIDPTWAWTARLMLGLLFSGAVVAFTLMLPRRPEADTIHDCPTENRAGRTVDLAVGLRRAARG